MLWYDEGRSNYHGRRKREHSEGQEIRAGRMGSLLYNPLMGNHQDLQDNTANSKVKVSGPSDLQSTP